MFNGKLAEWFPGVKSKVVGSIIVILLLAWAGHFKSTAQTARSAEENKAIAQETNDTVKEVVEVVKGLASIHSAGAAATLKVAELCKAGIVTDCSECSKAKVKLEKCAK